MAIIKALAALLLPLVLIELVLLVSGYEPPDNRRRLALFPKFPEFYEPERDLGWRFKPDFVHGEMTPPGRFRTDSEGNRISVGGLVSAGAPVLADCLGDSSTFGFLVADAATFPSRLQALLGGPVRNLGVPGFNARTIEVLVEARVDPAPVSLIMVGFNDHFPSPRNFDDELRERRAAYLCFESRLCSLLFDLFVSPRATGSGGMPERLGPFVPLKRYREALVGTIRTLRGRGSEPILLVYPSLVGDEKTRDAVAQYWKQSRSEVDENYAAHPIYQQATRDVANDEDVTLVDVAASFTVRGNERLHMDWVHPNPRGYNVIARAAAPLVRRQLALSRDSAGG